jgi:hypothetical protein
MQLILHRVLLFLLLGLDWAADPSLLAPALHPLAKAWCNTENVCPSGGYQRALRREIAPAKRPSDRQRIAGAPAPSAPTFRAEWLARATSLAGQLYVFMSLRR